MGGLKYVFLLFFILARTISSAKSKADSLELTLKSSPLNKNYVRNTEKFVWYLINPIDNELKADSILKVGKKVALKIGNFEGYGRLRWYEGIIYLRNSDSKASLSCMKEVEKLVKKYNLSKSLLQKTFAGIGNCHFHEGQYDKAMVYFTKATELTEKYNLTETITLAYIGISGIYLTYDVSKALALNQKLLKATYQDTDLTMRFLGEFQVCSNYLSTNNIPKALEFLKKSEINATKYCRKSIVINCWVMYSQIYMQQNQQTEALYYLEKAKKLAEGLNIDVRKSQVYGALGNYYFLKKNYKEAENYFLKKLEIDKKDKYEFGQLEGYEALSEINLLSKNYKNALDFKNKAETIEDSLFSKKLTNKINNLEKEKQDANIKVLELTNKNTVFQRNALLIGGILIFILSFTLIFSIVNRNKYKRIETQQKLRNQIAADLHDEIGSTLSSISILSEMAASQQKNGKLLPNAMEQVSSDAREVIEKMDDIIWTINPENDDIDNLENRIKAYAIPLCESKGIELKFDFSKEIITKKIDIAVRRDVYLIIKEAVNNCVKYSESFTVEVNAKIAENRMIFSIIDKGVGFDSNVETKRNGLKNIKMRAEKIGASLEIKSEIGKGTEIILKVPN